MSWFELCVYCWLTGYLNFIFLWRFLFRTVKVLLVKIWDMCVYGSDLLGDACNSQYFTSSRSEEHS